MENIQEIIDEQIELNEGINLFSEDEALFRLSKNLSILSDNIQTLNTSQTEIIINYTVNKVLHEFCRVNQYYNFDRQSVSALKVIYSDFCIELKAETLISPEKIKIHHQKLKEWLNKTNPFAEEVYLNKDKVLTPVSCFEYSAELQLNILQLDMRNIIEPVLDIGCGENANLVNYLRKNGIKAFGIDRYDSDYSYIENINWLEYDFGNKKWGTIISNLGFSNHFMHHHLREDGDYLAYAKKYMEILNSLSINGSFHYAPGIPFIEKYLAVQSYSIRKKEFKQGHTSVVITRLK